MFTQQHICVFAKRIVIRILISYFRKHSTRGFLLSTSRRSRVFVKNSFSQFLNLLCSFESIANGSSDGSFWSVNTAICLLELWSTRWASEDLWHNRIVYLCAFIWCLYRRMDEWMPLSVKSTDQIGTWIRNYPLLLRGWFRQYWVTLPPTHLWGRINFVSASQ